MSLKEEDIEFGTEEFGKFLHELAVNNNITPIPDLLKWSKDYYGLSSDMGISYYLLKKAKNKKNNIKVDINAKATNEPMIMQVINKVFTGKLRIINWILQKTLGRFIK